MNHLKQNVDLLTVAELH